MDFSSLLLSIFVFATFVFTAFYLFNILPLIRSLTQIIKNSHRTVDWAAELLLASPTGTVTVAPIVFTADPSNVEHTAKSHFYNYPRSNFVTSAFHEFLGDGILNSNGEQWKLQRKMASYEFSTGSLRTFVLEKVGHVIQERLLPLLKSASMRAEVLDLQDVFERFAFDNISTIAIDYDPDCLSRKNEIGERLYGAFDEAANISLERSKLPFSFLWKLKKLLNIRSERRLRESMAVINEFLAESFIRSKGISVESTEKRGGFLSKFARDARQSDKFVGELLVNLMLAGRDTTPSALTWFFWLVQSSSSGRVVVGKILEEVRSVRKSQGTSDEGKFFTLDSLRQMNYLHAAISESMRLYPPVPLVARECQADDTLPDGTAVKKGWMVMYSPMAMGRSKKIWGKDCAEFRPERWLVDGVFRARSPFEHTVFHAGRNMCLGKDMAFIQMKAVAASVLERFEMEAVEERGKHECLVTLKMEGGLPVIVRERRK